MSFTGVTTLLSSPHNTFVGVEFRDDSLVISCLRNSLSGLRFLSSSTFPLRYDEETLTEIANFISRYAGGASNVFVSIPLRWSIIKFTEVPLPKGRGKDALIQMMRFEVERHIPYQIDEVFYDFQILEKRENMYAVVFVAVHKEKIDYVKGFLEKVSLRPEAITLSSFAVLNSLEFSGNPPGGLKGFLGFAGKPKILGGKGDICLSLSVEGNEIQAALLKGGTFLSFKSVAFNQDDSIDKIAEDVSSELKRVFADGYGAQINKLIFSGKYILLAELSNALSNKIGVKAQIADPLIKIPGAESLSKKYELVPSIGACYAGFTPETSRINLLPHKTDAAGKTGTVIARVSLILILFLTAGIFSGEVINSKRLLAKIDEALKENEPGLKVIERMTGELLAIQKKKDFLLGRKESDVVIDALAELTKVLPLDAWLIDFDYKEVSDDKNSSVKGEIIIIGFASSSSALISILEDSPFFEKVGFVGSITRVSDKEGFKIKAMVVKSPEPLQQKQDLKAD